MTEWRPIPGYERNYEVSSTGQVRSRRRRGTGGGVLRQKVGKRGYPAISLVQDCHQQTVEVHRLVALAFLGPPPPGCEVRHLDGDKMLPTLTNLAYGTRSQNQYDKRRHGTDHNARKTHCPKGHPYDAQNTRVIPSRPSARYCGACADERGHR